MASTSERNVRLERQRTADLEKLRSIEIQAGQPGLKLPAGDRLKAAFHLTRAWTQANKAGFRKEDFQDAIFSRLRKPHQARREFRLSNWTLRRGEDPTTQPGLSALYRDKSTPQKALEPYLVGLTVAAEYVGVDPDEWKLDMLRELSIWSRSSRTIDIAPPDDRPAETLEILLRALCAELAKRNGLNNVVNAIRGMSCRWEMFSEQLVATDGRAMDIAESTFSPACNTAVYFEEMFPFPSITLLRVPYLVADAEFLLAPEDLLRIRDDAYLSTGEYWPVGSPIQGDGVALYCIPADAPGLKMASGQLSWLREVRLCIAPDGHGGFTSSLETRPRAEVRFSPELPFGGTHHVVGGYEPGLERGLFYARGKDGGHVWPHILTTSGEAWRITLRKDAEGNLLISNWSERNSEASGWWFDPDPVLRPGDGDQEPWYLSYTPASAPYLRHWLTNSWQLGSELADCPWDRSNFNHADPESPWNRELPPVHELNFPDFSHATWIECCLHNGLIEDAMQTAIDHLTDQVGRLQADWHSSREKHTNALLQRWRAKSGKMEAKR